MRYLRLFRGFSRNATFASVFAIAIVAGRATRIEQSDISLVWPAAAVAAIWMTGVRSSRDGAIAGLSLTLCAGVTTYLTGVDAGLSVGFAVVNLIIGWGTAAMLRVRGGIRLREPIDLAWLLVSVAAATGVAAMVGGILLEALHGASWWQSTFTFWTRNGVTTFLGLALLATFPRHQLTLPLPTRARAAGDLVAWVFAVGVYALVFVVNVGLPLSYFVLPVGVLMALRWSTWVCVWHMLASDVFVLVATVHERGPFLDADPAMRAVLAQGLIGCALLIVLTVALYRDSRNRLLLDVEQAHRDAQEAAGRLRHASLHDPLTGLPNRLQLEDVLATELRAAAGSWTHVGVLFLDLNGFKAVNDTFGHAEGDLLLEAVAMRLHGMLRTGDSVARLGGDEFVMVCPGLTVAGQLTAIQERLAVALREPYVLCSGRIHKSVSASIGAAQSTSISTIEQLIRDADTEMYAAKNAATRDCRPPDRATSTSVAT